MTDRVRLDALTSDRLDALYIRAEKAERATSLLADSHCRRRARPGRPRALRLTARPSPGRRHPRVGGRGAVARQAGEQRPALALVS
ncbi:hypothetical protein [Streptomyces sp. NPDC056921]|uniref:hypothetical protein n=1 Tax=Streptomyces sp. NPDC056921 TaxID=3345966 RepID=UPI003644D98E